MYTNWLEYLCDPSLELKQRDDLNFKKSGRPRIEKQAKKDTMIKGDSSIPVGGLESPSMKESHIRISKI